MPKRKKPVIFNAVPAEVDAGSLVEVQLAPFGDWPWGDKVVQHCTPETLQTVSDAFDGDLVVDVDHKSYTGEDTRAAAWVKSVRVDPKNGLMGSFEFTDYGAELVGSKEFRFVSVEWEVSEDGNPEKLCAVALTNRPNLPVAPILNARIVNIQQDTPNMEEKPKKEEQEEQKPAEAVHEEPKAEEKPAEAPAEDPKPAEDPAPAEAPEEDELEKLRAENARLSDECEKLKKRLADIDAAKAAEEKAAKEAEADKFAAEFDEKDREAVKNAYLADPEQTKRLVNSRRKPAESTVAPVLNLKPEASASPVLNARQVWQSMPPGPEKVAFLIAHRGEM